MTAPKQAQHTPMVFLATCAEAMNAYRQLTQDRSYGSRLKQGKAQLVRVEYDGKGKSTVSECSPWIPVNQWLDYMNALCADDQDAIRAIECAS